MTEIICPTCGQKCNIDTITNHEGKIIKEWFDKGRNSIKRTNKSGCCCMFEEDESISIMCAAHREICPDLTKLREVWKVWGLDRGFNIDLFIIGDKEMDRRMRKALIQAVKELLEGNK